VSDYAEQRKLVGHMLRELEGCDARMTKWEQGFIADIQERYDNGRQLTESQLEKLKEVYGEKTA